MSPTTLTSARAATSQLAPVCEIVVSGPLDATTGPELRKRILEAGDLGYRVCIDLGDVPTMDAAGLAAIIGPRRRLRALGLDVVLSGVRTPGVLRTLSVTRFAPMFDLGLPGGGVA